MQTRGKRKSSSLNPEDTEMSKKSESNGTAKDEVDEWVMLAPSKYSVMLVPIKLFSCDSQLARASCVRSFIIRFSIV